MPYYNRDPKRDHNFENHPYKETIIGNPNKGRFYSAVIKIFGMPRSAKWTPVAPRERLCASSMIATVSDPLIHPWRDSVSIRPPVAYKRSQSRSNSTSPRRTSPVVNATRRKLFCRATYSAGFLALALVG